MPLDVAGAARAVALGDARLGYPRTTMQDAIPRYRETGFYTRRCTVADVHQTERYYRYIVSNFLRNRFTTVSVASNRLFKVQPTCEPKNYKKKVSREGPKSISTRFPELNTTHRRARLKDQEYLNWTSEKWKTVLFCDESRIILWGSNGRQRVYRTSRWMVCWMCCGWKLETVGYEGGSIMAWGGDARTVNAHRYVTEVLEPLVILFALFSSETCNWFLGWRQYSEISYLPN